MMENFQRRHRNGMEGTSGRFQREFLNVEFGHSCKVCNRLCFSNKLYKINGVQTDEGRAKAIKALQKIFPDEEDVADLKVCGTCKTSLLEGKRFRS